MAEQKERGTRDDPAASSAVGKAFSVLKVLRDAHGALTLTAIAQQVGVAPSSAHSILSQLLREEAVAQVQDKRYQLGPHLFYLGAAFARGTPIYRSIWMELLAAASDFGVTAAIAVPWDRHHLVLNAHRAAGSDVAIPFGGRVPLEAASWGKVYFGWADDEMPQELGRYTDSSVTDPEEFRKEVCTAKKAGYATDAGEYFEGVGGVAAPVTSLNGYEGLATFVGPIDRVESIGFSELGRRVSLLTARASHALGDGDRIRFFGGNNEFSNIMGASSS